MKQETTQRFVCYRGEEELSRLMAYLDAHGYENVGRLGARSYSFPVVCVDPRGVYFGTNTACMAAAASCGIRAVGLSEFFAQEERGGEGA